MKITLESEILDIDKAALKVELEKKGVEVLEIRRPRTASHPNKRGEYATPVQIKTQVDLVSDGDKKITKKKQEELQKILDSHEAPSNAKSLGELEAILKQVQEQIKLLKNAK